MRVWAEPRRTLGGVHTTFRSGVGRSATEPYIPASLFDQRRLKKNASVYERSMEARL